MSKLLFSIFMIFIITSFAYAEYECETKTIETVVAVITKTRYCGDAQGFTLETVEKKDSFSRDYILKYNGKSVLRLVDSEYFIIDLKKAFTIKGDKVVLLELNTGGTACPALYTFVTVKSDGTAKKTEEFGTCSDLVEVFRQADTVIVKMPKLQGTGKETYIYKDGNLIRGK